MEAVSNKRVWRGFWQLADPKIWIASTIPMLVGAGLAYSTTKTLNLYWFLISLVGIYLIEIGKNAVNEVVDYKTGVDTFVTPDKRNPFSGGKKTIIDGMLTVKEATIIAIVTLSFSAIIGIYIVLFREVNIIWIGLAGLLFSIFYSVPPFKFAYNGLGEFIVGITFGPLILMGIYVVLTQRLDFSPIIVSLPIGFLIANVLFINQYPDYEADLKGNKKNLLIRVGKEKGIVVYKSLFILSTISFIIISLYFRNPVWLLGLAVTPISIKAVKVAEKHYNDIPKLLAANGKTIMIYQLTGVIMIVCVLIGV